MKMNLRKAAGLVRDIESFMISLTQKAKFGQQYELSIYSKHFEKDLNEREIGIHNDVDTMRNLIASLYMIRGLIGDANHTSGINSALNAKALLERNRKLLMLVCGYDEPRLSQEKMDEKLKQVEVNNTNASNHFLIQSINLNPISSESMDGFKAELLSIRREISDLTDKLAELNLKTAIEIPDIMMESFKNLGIV